MAKRLRSGYTTGACAAAAAKAAALVARDGNLPELVELVFPDNSVHSFAVYRAKRTSQGAKASVIKDAGDDPDVTNRAEIVATVYFSDKKTSEKDWITVENVQISAGLGVGTVTKPGLAVPVGEPAINPVPRQMICKAVQQVESKKNGACINLHSKRRRACRENPQSPPGHNGWAVHPWYHRYCSTGFGGCLESHHRGIHERSQGGRS